MSDIAIKVENLSKKYQIGHGQSGSLRETLSGLWHNTFGGKSPDVEEFWALRDINFEIKQGEAVGIIGRNGAGKSTLLKLLSKITYPTTGKITMNGRVSSLLEVGTGFHPELTGRENIYLNGTILGMSRKEVKSKFDEIVDFSGVEKFLDTPVKRYSSGMYVRLAFAVAAHLEPEILIIDEVLAVGDAEFQKKCIGKMGEVTKEGRTVLFVSHNMTAIQNLCSRAILIKSGNLIADDNINNVLNVYKSSVLRDIGKVSITKGVYDLEEHPNKKCSKEYGLIKALLFCDNKLSNTLYPGCEFKLVVKVCNPDDFDFAMLGFIIRDPNGDGLIGINNKHIGKRFEIKHNQVKDISITILDFPIVRSGNFTIDLYYGNYNQDIDIIIDAISFDIEKRNIYNSSHLLDERVNSTLVKNIDIEIL